jgi:hypothetical protein
VRKKMGAMSELDLSLRELIFEGTLEENIKANVGTEIKIRCWSTYKNLRNYNYVVTEKDVINYYTSEVAREDNCIG